MATQDEAPIDLFEKVDFEAFLTMRGLGCRAEFARLSSQHAAMIGPCPTPRQRAPHDAFPEIALDCPMGSPIPHFDSSDPCINCNDRGIP